MSVDMFEVGNLCYYSSEYATSGLSSIPAFNDFALAPSYRSPSNISVDHWTP